MAEKSSEKQDAAAQCEDPDDSYMYTDDDIRSYSDDDWESCSSDSSLSSHILIHLLRRAEIYHHGRRVKNKREANETVIDGVSKECAAKNARELVQEEEREKQKAEKRKAKKKRRKEKKKEKQSELNKNTNKDSNTDDNIDSNKNNVSEDNKVTKQKKKGRLNSNSSEERDKQSEEEAGSESDVDEDDFLDLNSAFVTNAANKNKQKTVTKVCRKKITVNNEDSAADEGEKLALQGYLAAKNQQYQEAVNHFTKAINLIKNDYRFYSNRSFCYCQLGHYAKGLKDADIAIQCLPNNPKGYFRRGEALKYLKQYKEAEEAFLKALELDSSIIEARQELNNLKVQQLLDMGFKLHEAQAALQQHSTVQAAVEALSITKDEPLEDEDEIFYSDDEEETPRVAKIDLSNPLGLTSLWVGNVTDSVTEKQLLDVFSRYGEIVSVKLLPQSYCAFVNYKDKSAPGPAMRGLQGIFMGGQNLIIRFPNSAAADTQQKALLAASTSHLKAKGPVNSNECHFWRTTGCTYGDKCRYIHIPQHKGIDKKPWHKVTE